MLTIRRGDQSPPTAATGAASCRQCGRTPSQPGAKVCQRCGIPFGGAPREDIALPTCHLCYATVSDDGLLPSLAGTGRGVPIADHLVEHDRYPVGDDEWLESLRHGDRIRVGRWEAPFDLVRRYLVTGVFDAGRRRAIQHDAVVTAMSQLTRWGASASSLVGDQPDWREARDAISALMERFHRH